MPSVLLALVVGFGSSRARARSRSAARLAADSRGAILVLGILLGAMLVSVLFHIASVGQAILWREGAQDAADAVAYEAALWNARGMNVIVALNIFLALLIAILMFWRLVLIVVTTMLVLSAIACLAVALIPGMQFLQPLCNMTPRLANIVRNMVQRDMRYTPRLYRAMTLIHRGQVIVGSATPIISAVRSSTHVMNDESYDVELALGVGVQLLPSRLYPPSPEPGDEPGPLPCGVEAANRAADLSGTILGKPVSLPMQHWFEIDELCGKGATMQTQIIDEILGQLADVLGFGELGEVVSGGPFAEIWSFIAEILSPVLCESLNGSVAERFEEIIDRACSSDPDRLACEQRMRDEADKNNSSTDTKGTKPNVGGVSSDDVLYAKPYWLAQNGNLFMQSWGLVLAKRRFVADADRLIRFSNRFGGEDDFKEVEDEAWVVAGAEMFLDTEDGWEKGQYQAPWTMNWRARLRRFHDPGEYAGGVAEIILVEGFWGGIVDRLLEKGPLGNLINRFTGSGLLQGTMAGRFGGSHIHGFVLSLARQELTERGRATTYQHLGLRSAASRAFEQLGAGKNEIIH
jgi:hypothetical protein